MTRPSAPVKGLTQLSIHVIAHTDPNEQFPLQKCQAASPFWAGKATFLLEHKHLNKEACATALHGMESNLSA